MPHPEREHSLQIEVARLQRERDALVAANEKAVKRAHAAESALAAELRAYIAEREPAEKRIAET